MSELTDRMRTCAARIRTVCGPDDIVYNDAAALLLEASEILDENKIGTVLLDDQTAQFLGLPMEIIPPATVIPPAAPASTVTGTWVDPGGALPTANPYRSVNTCPKCDSRSVKTVYREDKRFVLECPACGYKWWKR